MTVDVGFKNSLGNDDETELDIEKSETTGEGVIELLNLILSLKDEMDIQEITYIEYRKYDGE